MPLTQEQLDHWQKLADDAKPGPWTWYAEDASMVTLCQKDKELEVVVLWSTRCESCAKHVTNDQASADRLLCGWPSKEDGDFILAAREAVPALLAEVKRLQRERNLNAR